MASFRYTAVSAGGELTHGLMDAESEREVISRLQRQGATPMRAAPAEGGGGFLSGLLTRELGRGGALRRQEVTNLTRELSVMLEAGQDLDRALRFLVDTGGQSTPEAGTGAAARHGAGWRQLHQRADPAAAQLSAPLCRAGAGRRGGRHAGADAGAAGDAA